MENRLFGKTGEKTSILGFGCMRLPVHNPDDQSSIDIAQSVGMVRDAIDHGVNYIDTAWPYHRNGDLTVSGASEPFLATALADGYREKVLLATKLPTWFMDDEQQMHGILDQQLKRLGTGHIDMYLAHNLNRLSWPKMRDIGMFRFLEQAQRDGRIRHIGFSFHDRYELFEDIINAFDWSFCQIQYNYMDIEHQAGKKGLELAASKNLGVVVMEPLRGGFLINGLPDHMRAKLAAIRPEWSMADWGLRWLWSQPGVSVVLSGMSTPEQVRENCTIANTFSEPLTGGENEALAMVRQYFLSQTKVNCTGCGYCLPCPAGVDIPAVFTHYNIFCRFTDANSHFQARNTYFTQVQKDQRAAGCVACQQCEAKCPQNIPISQMVKEAAEAIGG